jgi:hypothetical protein
MLTTEILWAFENSAFRKESVLHNRKFIEENRLQNQHENNRKQISRIN